MSIGWVITGTFLQGCLALFLFMLVAFSGGGVANGRALRKFQLGILDRSLYLLPATCILSAAIVIYQYSSGGGLYSYWWYGLPLLATVSYFIYLNKVIKG